MTWCHYSLTSNDVVGCTFSFSSAICKLRSNWILIAFSFASKNPLANLWIRKPTSKFAEISSLGTQLQVSSTIFSNYQGCATTSFHWRFSYSMLIHSSLSSYTMHPSLARSSVVAPSCCWYNISCGGGIQV